ncbi:MAG: hypothetical protein NVSMB53_07390 [Gemmatimonadaceae bacterium]
MIEHNFPEDFVPIAAELQRRPYLSPSSDFADRVISRIDRLQPARSVAPVSASGHLELRRGGQQAVVRRRPKSVIRTTGKAVAGVGLIAVAAFMFLEIDVLTAVLSAAAAQYAFVIAAVGAQIGFVVLGPAAMAYLEAGALQAVLLYITLVFGLFAGYAAIRTAAQVAKRKAA